MNDWMKGPAALLLAAWGIGAASGVEVVSLATDECQSGSTPFLLTSQGGRPYEAGFRRDGADFVCDNGTNAMGCAGVSWFVRLDRRETVPFVFSGEARAEGRNCGSGGDFCLYVDVTYQDGGHLWGQRVDFDPDPEAGWQRRSVTVMPDRPVKSFTAYGLQRGRAGRVRFRNLRARELEGALTSPFDMTAVKIAHPLTNACLLVRDVAAGTGYHALDGEALGVRARMTAQVCAGVPDAALHEVCVEETTGRDRALTFVYVQPLPADGASPVLWHVDPRRTEPLKGERLSVSTSRCGCGALSLWPFGAVSAGARGQAIGIDPAAPAFYRVAAHESAGVLLIAFDVGLTSEVPRARLRFCTFGFEGELGFRGALERYARIFPEMFRVRIARHGVWMPFLKTSTVKGWEDFGFLFKEGDNETDWDDAHGLMTFRYTEPCTWWMPMKGDVASLTLSACEAEAERLAAAGDSAAKGWRKSAFRDGRGRRVAHFLDTPWCKGAVWSVNSAPGVAGDWETKNGDPGFSRLYERPYPQGLDGEYVDSSELYMTAEIDFNRSSFAHMETPLCFSRDDCRVGIFKGLVGYEYVRGLARRVWPKGRFTMANSTPISWCWLAPYLDVMGTETNWNPGDEKAPPNWRPMSDDQLMYRRALCGGKPYCFLMNTTFNRFTHEMCEKFMQRSLAYGMFPGFFSADAANGHYFSQPDLYERDRPLFRKYIPLCRMLSEAGWRPVNRLLRSENPQVYAEQFGDQAGRRWVTVFNPDAKAVRVRLEQLVDAKETRELVTGDVWRWTDGKLEIELPPETVRVVSF